MKLLKRTRIEAAILLALVPVYVCTPFLIDLPEGVPGSTALQTGTVLLCLAIVAAIPAMRTTMMGRMALPGLDDLRSFGAEPISPEELDEELDRVLRVYRQGTLTGMAMAQMIGVLGLVLAVVQASPVDAIPFAILAACGMGAQFPVDSGWRALLSLGARASLGHPA